MSTGDMLGAEELAEAHIDGRAAGRVVGLGKARMDILIELLTIKFGYPSESVREAALQDLETWTARVLTSDTIDVIFERPGGARAG